MNQQYSGAVIVSAQTANPGSGWVNFAALACTKLDVANISGFTIEYRRNGAGLGFPIFTNSGRSIVGITDASQISIRRVDQSNTQAILNGEAIT